MAAIYGQMEIVKAVIRLTAVIQSFPMILGRGFRYDGYSLGGAEHDE